MTREQIRAELENILHEELKGRTLEESMDLRKELQADSITLLDMIMSIEEKFNISLEDQNFEDMQTVKDVIDKIEELS